jgi:hypothetical protein
MAKTTPRKTQYQVVHTIARVLNYNDADVAAAYVGTIPAQSVVIATDAVVTTAFNGGVNNMSVGTQAVLTELLTSAQGAAGSGGMKLANAPNASPFLVDTLLDQDVYANYNQSGSVATAGRAVLIVRYVPYTRV